MRKLKHSLLVLFGCFFIAIALFAFKFGWDPTPGWGKSRILSFLLGISFIAAFIDLRFGKSWTERTLGTLSRQFGLLLDNTPIARWKQHHRTQLMYGTVGTVFLLVVALYAWFTSSATWTKWPNTSSYYSLLGDAFANGRVWIDVEVNPQILALENPYDPEARAGLDYLWDASLYKGKYYFYWGPAPAVLLAVIKLIYPFEVGDNLVTFAAAICLFLVQMLLLMTLWKRYFEHLPGWTLILGILLAGATGPVTWMLHWPMVYEAAIFWAQAFLIAGIYFAYRAFEGERPSPARLAWASVCWVAAIGSRTITLFPVLFLLLCVLIRILRLNGPARTSLFWKQLLGLGIPMLAGAIGLAAYNQVRFDSVFDFGFDYQLTAFDMHEHKDELFSIQYVPANIYNYLFNPPQKINRFPYFKSKTGIDTEVIGIPIPGFYNGEEVSGLVYSIPFLVFSILSTAQQFEKNWRNVHLLNWVRAALGGAALAALAGLFVFFNASTRYLADATPSLISLAVIGFWSGYESTASDKFVQFVYSVAGILLALVSVAVPNLLALLSAGGIMQFSPQVFPALDAFYKSIFGR